MTSGTEGTGVSLLQRTDNLAHTFSVLLRQPQDGARTHQLLAALESQHRDSVMRYGWRVAEAARSDAFAAACAELDTDSPEPLPAPEVSESDFGTFQKAQQPDERPAP